MKNELSGKTIKKVSALKPNTYSYIIDDDHSDKKAKGAKKCVVKWEIKFQDFQDCLENNKTIIRSQQRFRSEAHNVFIKNVNKTALSANDDKRL